MRVVGIRHGGLSDRLAPHALIDRVIDRGDRRQRHRTGRIRRPPRQSTFRLSTAGHCQAQHAHYQQSLHDLVGLHPWRLPTASGGQYATKCSAADGRPGHFDDRKKMIPVEREPSEVRKDGTKDLEDTPEPKTEPDGERSPREESYPDHPGKQGETGRRRWAQSVQGSPARHRPGHREHLRQKAIRESANRVASDLSPLKRPITMIAARSVLVHQSYCAGCDQNLTSFSVRECRLNHEPATDETYPARGHLSYIRGWCSPSQKPDSSSPDVKRPNIAEQTGMSWPRVSRVAWQHSRAPGGQKGPSTTSLFMQIRVPPGRLNNRKFKKTP